MFHASRARSSSFLRSSNYFSVTLFIFNPVNPFNSRFNPGDFAPIRVCKSLCMFQIVLLYLILAIFFTLAWLSLTSWFRSVPEIYSFDIFWIYSLVVDSDLCIQNNFQNFQIFYDTLCWIGNGHHRIKVFVTSMPILPVTPMKSKFYKKKSF